MSVDDFKQVIDPSPFTLNSIEGLLVIALIIFLVYAIGKRIIKMICTSAALLVFIEMLYGLSLTAFNNVVHISSVVKYSLMVSIAQLFPGTFISDGLITASAYILMWMHRVVEVLSGIF